MLELTMEELKTLEYELNYRWGELMGNGDIDQANRLAKIIDKVGLKVRGC